MIKKANKDAAPKKKAAGKKSNPGTAVAKEKIPLEKKKTASGPGKKYTCFQCGTKFYDLNKPEKICPKCGADQMAKPTTRTGKSPKSTEYDILEEEGVQDEEFRPGEEDFAIEDEEEI